MLPDLSGHGEDLVNKMANQEVVKYTILKHPSSDSQWEPEMTRFHQENLNPLDHKYMNNNKFITNNFVYFKRTVSSKD